MKIIRAKHAKGHFAFFAQRNQHEVVVKYLADRNVLFGVMFSLQLRSQLLKLPNNAN